MRKRAPVTITFKNVYGDNPTPEQKKEIEKRMSRTYDLLIGQAVDNILEKNKSKT